MNFHNTSAPQIQVINSRIEQSLFEGSDLHDSRIHQCNLNQVRIDNCQIEGLRVDGILLTELLDLWHRQDQSPVDEGNTIPPEQSDPDPLPDSPDDLPGPDPSAPNSDFPGDLFAGLSGDTPDPESPV